MIDSGQVGEPGRAFDLDRLPAGHHHPVDHRRRREYEGEIVLALETLADDVHVEEPEETAPETEAEGARGLGLEGEGRVVEVELVEGGAQVLEIPAVGGVEAAVDHRLGLLESGNRLARGRGGRGHGVAHLGVAHLADGAGEQAHLAGAERVQFGETGKERPCAEHLVLPAGGHEADMVAFLDRAVENPDQRDRPLVGVEPRVDDERARGRRRVAAGRRDPLDDGLEHLGHTGALLGADLEAVRPVEPEHLLDLGDDPIGVGRGKVDLVDDRDDHEVLLEGEVGVRQGLGLDALGRIDDEKRPLAGRQAPGDLVVEIDVPRGVDEVENIALARGRPVVEADAGRLDRDPPLLFEVHRVEHLRGHLAAAERSCDLENPVGERGLPVVDVGDYRKIADSLWVHGLIGTPEKGAETREAAGPKSRLPSTAASYRAGRFAAFSAPTLYQRETGEVKTRAPAKPPIGRSKMIEPLTPQW